MWVGQSAALHANHISVWCLEYTLGSSISPAVLVIGHFLSLLHVFSALKNVSKLPK
jgi:hypothetical protein